jgi:hypothetical protein
MFEDHGFADKLGLGFCAARPFEQTVKFIAQ